VRFSWVVFQRFTARAHQVVVLAQEEAQTLKHNYIGTEHILLGLLREGQRTAARVLESLDITVESGRAEVRQSLDPGREDHHRADLVYGARSRKDERRQSGDRQRDHADGARRQHRHRL
jgi:ATP-dependent Clp protease ATP-binding subunit ClpA